MNKDTQRLLLNICVVGVLTILLGMISAMSWTVQAQDSDDMRRSEVQAMTFTQLQEMFYKVDIEKEISLDILNLTLEQALREIAQETGLRLSYRGDIMVDKTVTLQENGISVTNALDYIMKDTGLDYKFSQNGYLVITEANGLLEEQIFQDVVNGTVIDSETGEALPGVNILVQGTTDMGTTTNIDGYFELAVPDLNQTLVFSYIGYNSKEVAIDGREELYIELMQDVQLLEDLIVVGYGTQQRRDITGSVRQISGRDLEIQPSVRASSGLMGKIPGLQVIQSSGQPGADQPTLLIRGTGTLGNSSPLVLIDGVQSSMHDIPSSDIESITVLKDASASAIYGSRAANGVILVTTKRGLSEGLEITYRTYAGIRASTGHPEFTDAGTFMRLENEALTNVGSSSVWSDDFIREWETNYQSDPDRYPNTDWVSEVYSETGYQINHHLNIAGGTERVRYRGSLGYDNEQGEIPNFGYQRYDVRLNTDIKASEMVDLTIDLNVQRRDRQSANASSNAIQRNTYRIPPIYPARYSHGGWAPGWNNDNPVAFANDGGVNRLEGYDLRGRINARIQPIENLEFNIMYSPYRWTNSQRNMTRRYEVTSIDSPEEIVALNPSRNRLGWGESNLFRHTFNATGRYVLDLSNQSISFLGGFEFIDHTEESLSAARFDFELQDFEVLNAGSPDTQSNNGNISEWALASFFGRMNYQFLDRYLIEANLRYDGSSRFAEGNRWGLFPSFSAGWIVSDESFMDRLDFISNLKVRASWGQLGNQNVGTYPFASVVSLNRSWIFGGQQVIGAAQTSLANQDISWETTTSQNIGLDVAFLQDRLYLAFDYFHRRTEDILLNLPVPRILGKSAPTQNAAVVDNRGWELEAGFLGNIGSDFTYNLSFNISDVENEVIDLRGAGPFTGTTATIEGYPIGVLFGYETNGLFQNQQEIDDHATQFGTVAPGDIRYVDQNGDGVINEDDRVVLGDPFPRLSFGINLAAQYKNFDFSAFIQGVGKRDVYLSGDAAWAFYNGGKIADWQAENYWTPDNTDALYPRLTHASSHNNFRASDYWIFNASYLRLRNLQIGYTLPPAITENLQLRGMRVFLQGQNLFTLSRSYENGGLPPGIDPNVPNATLGGFYPISRLISGGIEVNF